MRPLWLFIILLIPILQGCAAVFTDASDANHVTFLNSAEVIAATDTES